MALKSIPLQATAAQQVLVVLLDQGGDLYLQTPSCKQDNLLDHLLTYLWTLWPLSGRDTILVSDVQHVIGCVP